MRSEAGNCVSCDTAKVFLSPVDVRGGQRALLLPMDLFLVNVRSVNFFLVQRFLISISLIFFKLFCGRFYAVGFASLSPSLIGTPRLRTPESSSL